MERSAARTRLQEETARLLDAVAEPDDRTVKQQCNHFSIREYVSLLQKKDPKRYSLSQIFCKQQHQNELQNLCPISATKFRRWNCSGCLDKVKVADRTTSIDVSPEQNGTNSGCSISFIRSVMSTSVDYTRRLPCTQRSSQGNEAAGSAFPKSTQECNSPSGSKGVPTEMNVDRATKDSQESPNNLDMMENMSNDASVDVSVLPEIPQIRWSTAENGTKESQESTSNFNVMEIIPNDASMDASTLPDVPQKISSTTGNDTKELQGSPDNLDAMANVSNDVPKDDSPEALLILSREGTGTPNLSSPKSCEVLNEDENERTNIVLNGDCSAPNVAKPTEEKGPKPISGHKGSQVRNRGPRQAAAKRNAGSSSKKKQKESTYPSGISDLKFCHRKRKRMRRLSELIETDQTVGPTNSLDIDHAKTNDLCESDKGKFSLVVEKDTGTVVSNQRAEEIQSRTVQNKIKLKVDDVDDRSSLMNWLNKKVRTEKKDSGQRNVDSSVVSISTPGIPASEKLHHYFVPSVADQSQEEDPATINAKNGNKSMQNNYPGPNMLHTHDLCQNEPGNSKQRSLSKGKSTILLKRKVPLTDNTKHDEIKSGNRIVKRKRIEADDKGQMASENFQKHLRKVSLGKGDTHNVPGTRDQKMATNKKKQKLQMPDKEADEINDIPMDVVELLARHQHERQLMTEADSLENSHSQPKITQEDCDQIAAMDGSNDASIVLDTNFQESLTSQRKQKILCHASSIIEAPNVHLLEELDTQMSVQGHAISGVVASEEQMQNKLPIQAASITEAFHVYPPKLRIPDILMCTEEQRTHSHMDNEVTIACVSPTFSHRQDIAEVPTRSLGTNRAKKLMWDSFKTASRSPLTSSYGAQFRSGFQEGGSSSTHVFGASNNYPTYPPAVEHYTKKAVNQIPLSNQAMEAGRLYDQRITGQSGLYPRETVPATHLLRLMDSSTTSGFTNRNWMEFEASGSSQYMQNQYKASLSPSYGSHMIEKFPLTLEDLARHQVQKNLHRPLRPLPRVGVLGSLLQKDIAKWSEHCGTHTGYKPGASKGIASFDTNRKENSEVWNSGMFSARWNALQLGSVSSAASPEYSSLRYCEPESWTRGRGKVVHPLDKLVRKDICQTNRNPADFTIISDKNEYMINL